MATFSEIPRESADDEEKWRNERQKALEEWSEIELRLSTAALPVSQCDLGTAHSDCEKASFSDSSRGPHIRSPLLRELFAYDYTELKKEAEEELSTAVTNSVQSVSFLRRCVCRPVSGEQLSSQRLADERLLLLALSRTTFSSIVPEHWMLLQEIFKRCTKSDEDESFQCARSGGHWDLIGFQGADPSTDLRGAGIFGLVQLYCLVTEILTEDIVKRIIALSQDPIQNFPFAVVGLNFTSLIINGLKLNQFNGLANDHNSFLTAVNLVYRGCFLEFYKEWKAKKCTIASFQAVLSHISDLLKRDAASLILVKLDD